ncbi:MAG: hypothetical protein ACI867_000093 [Glaciecola sp.]|jgi:hypothetical protein
MVNDFDGHPEDAGEPDALEASSDDIAAALSDLLSSGHAEPAAEQTEGEDIAPGDQQETGEHGAPAEFSLSEDLGDDFGNLDPELADELAALDSADNLFGDEPAAKPRANLGLDLTEFPAPSAPSERPKMPPLGEATADDLFGPVDDELPSGLPSSWEEDPSASAPHSAATDPSPGEPATRVDPEAMEARGEPDVSMGDMAGFTAHGGQITGDIREKAKKFFGR